MLLRKKTREKVRKIAREEYVVAVRMHDFHREKATIAKIARKNARNRLRDTPEFGGILNALLLSIATKLLTELIKHWIDENLTQPSRNFSQGEPGYE